jgi:DNA-binding GntR family transcriptional regulator
MSLLRIDNRTLSQKVYEELKQKMITAELQPGERISLRTIASQFGVSLTPVREAIWQLERDKAVVVKHNRQIAVNQLTPDDFDELLELRLLLEGKAAEMACSHRSDDDIRAAKSVLDKMHRSISDRKRFLHLNHEFHGSIYEISGMINLMFLIDYLWTRVGPYIYRAATTQHGMLQAMQFHNMMYDALVARDGERMMEALTLDLTTAAVPIRGLLEQQDRAGPGKPETQKAAPQAPDSHTAAQHRMPRRRRAG